MKILDNNGKVVFSGDWYPEAVTIFFKKMGRDVYENSVMDFLKANWEGSSYKCASLITLMKVYPALENATAEDTILGTDSETYLIPFNMNNNDSSEAYEFWQKILSNEFPSYILSNEEADEFEEPEYFSEDKALTMLDAYKERTGYFDGDMTYGGMYDMLRNRMKFGEAETRVIISALTLCGAKFAE